MSGNTKAVKQSLEPGSEATEDVTPHEPKALQEAELQPESTGWSHVWFLAVTILTTAIMVLYISTSRAWDAYLCHSDEDCRGVQRCFDGTCLLPEIWLMQQLEECERESDQMEPCITREMWERVR